MMTNETTPAATWDALTDGERAILAAMPIRFIDNNEIEKNYLANYRQEIQSLKNKKLIRPTLKMYKRVEAGDNVLAAGTVPTGQAEATVITAEQFVDGNYKAQIDLGHCVVKDNDGDIIEDIRPMITDDRYKVCVDCGDDNWYVVSAKIAPMMFTVEWITLPQPTPAPAAETVSGGEGWYYSSVAQWVPEYSTEKINGYDGPYKTWQLALEALFEEVGNDMDSFRSDLARLQRERNNLRVALEGCVADCTLSAIYVGDFYRDATKLVKARATTALEAVSVATDESEKE